MKIINNHNNDEGPLLLYRCMSVNQSHALQKRLASHEALQRVMTEQSAHAINETPADEAEILPSLSSNKEEIEDVLSDHRSSPILIWPSKSIDHDDSSTANDTPLETATGKITSEKNKKFKKVASFHNIIQRLRSSKKVRRSLSTQTTQSSMTESIMTDLSSFENDHKEEEQEIFRLLQKDSIDEGQIQCRMMDSSVRSIRILSSFSTTDLQEQSLLVPEGELVDSSLLLANKQHSRVDHGEGACPPTETNKNNSTTAIDRYGPQPQALPVSEIHVPSSTNADTHATANAEENPRNTIFFCGYTSATGNSTDSISELSFQEFSPKLANGGGWGHYCRLYQTEASEVEQQTTLNSNNNSANSKQEPEKEEENAQSSQLPMNVSALGSVLQEYLWMACGNAPPEGDDVRATATSPKKQQGTNEQQKTTTKKKKTHKKVPSTIQAHILQLTTAAADHPKYSPSLQDLDNCSTMTEQSSSVKTTTLDGQNTNKNEGLLLSWTRSKENTTRPVLKAPVFRFDIDWWFIFIYMMYMDSWGFYNKRVNTQQGNTIPYTPTLN